MGAVGRWSDGGSCVGRGRRVLRCWRCLWGRCRRSRRRRRIVRGTGAGRASTCRGFTWSLTRARPVHHLEICPMGQSSWGSKGCGDDCAVCGVRQGNGGRRWRGEWQGNGGWFCPIGQTSWGRRHGLGAYGVNRPICESQRPRLNKQTVRSDDVASAKSSPVLIPSLSKTTVPVPCRAAPSNATILRNAVESSNRLMPWYSIRAVLLNSISMMHWASVSYRITTSGHDSAMLPHRVDHE
jgi:hypothetical protein